MRRPIPTSLESTQDQATRVHRSTLLSQGLRIGCRAAGVLVLARLVTPPEHGLYAMAASVTLLLWIFRDMGLGIATVQTVDLPESLCTALLWTHLGIGLALTIATLIAAPFVARFYGQPTLIPLLGVMAMSFLFIGIGGLPRSLLMRNLRMNELNQLESISAVVGTATMILAAVAGAGSYAFATFLLVWEFLCAALAWKYCRWRPIATAQWSGLAALLRTGVNLTHYNALNFLSKQIETVAIGQYLGARTLGLYNRPGQILTLPTIHVAEPLSQISLTTLSRIKTTSPEFEYQAIVSTNIIAHLTLPIMAFAVAAPQEVVHVVLGPQWLEAAPILRWLAVSAVVTQLTLVAQSVAIAAGQSKRLTLTAIVTLSIIAIAVTAGLKHGAIGVAIYVAIANLLLAAPSLWWRLRGSPVTIFAYFKAIRYPILGAVALTVGATLGRMFLFPGDFSWRLLGALIGAGIGAALVGLISTTLREEWRVVWAHLPWAVKKPPISTAHQNDVP